MIDPSVKAEMLSTLRTFVDQLIRLRAAGAPGDRQSRAQGLVDGYMRAMLESGFADQRELLALVRWERERQAGPATEVLAVAEPASTVAA